MVIHVVLLCGLATLAVAFYYYLIWNYDFWKKCGLPGPTPQLIFGTQKDLILARKSVTQIMEDTYRKYKNLPAVGLYHGRMPVLYLRDPELIKIVLIKDFSKFMDRPHKTHGRTEPITLNLFNLESATWKILRAKQVPLFTTKKLKDMFNIMLDCSKKLEEHLEHTVSKNQVIEVREMAAKYATDVISSCIFGIDTNTIYSDDNVFFRISKRVYDKDFEMTMRFRLRVFLPKFYDLLGFVWPERRFASFFTKLVTDMINYRKKNNVYRSDFLQHFMEIKESLKNQSEIEFTDKMIMAQTAAYFGSGLDTVSQTINWAFLELAQNTDIQDKLRQEIKEYMKKYNGEITYEIVKEMPYMDKVFKETLRKYPVGPLVNREATSDYYFESLKLTIPKSTEVWIPTYDLHRDCDIYPNPTKFDPERFSKEAVAARSPMHYLPFGLGPRHCIGARLAIFKVKLCLLKIIQRYKLDVCEQTKFPIEYDPGSIHLAYMGPLYLKFTEIK